MATRILVVEDAPEYREFLTQSLIQEGYEVVVAEDGRQAMERIHDQEPDAVVCDMVMPRQSGLAFMNDLRAEHRRLPVILTSSWDSGVARDVARDLGAAAFVPKDTQPSVLLRALRSCLSRRAEFSLPRPPTCSQEVIAQGRFTLGSHPWRVLAEFSTQAAPILQAIPVGDRIRLAQGVTRAARVLMVCGNLELPPSMFGSPEMDAVVRQRLETAPYRDRQVAGMIVLISDRVRVTLSDHCRSLDYRTLKNLVMCTVESCATHVEYLDDGRRVELVYRLDPPLPRDMGGPRGSLPVSPAEAGHGVSDPRGSG